jgi:Na+/H+ antiporter
MQQFEIYVWLLGIIVCVGLLARNLPTPTPLLLVIVGMLLSFLPYFPEIELNSDIVLDIFLPLLVYEASTYTSWPDIKNNKRPIALLSVGHVVFITLLVAITAHSVIPELSWPLAFILGAIISPPDDVAIFAVAEKVQLPQRIITLLSAESLLNDATALTIFRFALAAAITHYFSMTEAIFSFFAIVIGETLYGLALGHLLGQVRMRVEEPMLQMLLSIVTPFLAYLPAVRLGGSGVLATVVTGLVIGHVYLPRLTPGSRLLWHAVWRTITFVLSSILFLLVGLKFNSILKNISVISPSQLIYYASLITTIVIVGRFLWVYPAAYLPRFLFPSIRKKDPYPPWQDPFIISWAGMRGGVSLAAALAIPFLATDLSSFQMRSLLVFLVFCVIAATLLIQGLTLPWLLRVLGADRVGRNEQSHEYFNELTAKHEMAEAVLNWLTEYKATVNNNPALLEEIGLQILEFTDYDMRLKEIMKNNCDTNAKNLKQDAAMLVYAQILEIEKTTLANLWYSGKINLRIRNKLLQHLDYRTKRIGS